MDTNLSNYLHKNLKDSIKSLEVVQDISKKTNEPYYAFDLVLINGYKKRFFLQNAEVFTFTNAFDLIAMNKVVDTL